MSKKPRRRRDPQAGVKRRAVVQAFELLADDMRLRVGDEVGFSGRARVIQVREGADKTVVRLTAIEAELRP